MWKFTVHVLLKPGLEDFEHYFTSMWDECNCVVVWVFFDIAFLWDWNENWPFPVLWPLLSFPNMLTYWVQHFHSIIFQDLKQLNWNSITSTSFVRSDAFSKAHLTSHSRISGSRWVITPSWLSRSWRSFLYHFCPYRAHLCMKCSLGISNFLEEISSLSHSVVVLYFFALIAEEGFLISSCYSLELCIQMLISFLFSFAFRLSSFHS